MIQRLDAVHQNGVFCPLQAVQGLDECARVRLTVEGGEATGRVLADIAGILPDEDARAIFAVIEGEFKQVDSHEW